jgi:hypothetical protein
MPSNIKTSSFKQRLLKDLEIISDSDIQKIVDFTEFLISRRSIKKKSSARSIPSPQGKDPILKLFGIADVEPFAHKIDKELYG